MHPFVHAFSPAIAPPWQTRTDFDAFHAIAGAFSGLAATHLGVRQDLVAVPLTHDTPDELATPGGVARDWAAGECAAVPGRTMPKLVVVERDYGAVAEKMAALGPLLDRLGTTTKGVTVDVTPEVRVPAPDQRRGERRCRRRPARAVDVTCTPARRSSRSPAPPTAASPSPASRRWNAGRAAPGRPGHRARGQAHPLRRHPGPPGAGDHQPRVVGQRARRPSLLPVHAQRRAAQAVAHAHRSAAPLRRPRLDARDGRGAAGVPAAAGHAPPLRRARA